VSLDARPAPVSPAVAELQANARRQARRLSGGVMAVVGSAFAIFLVAILTVLDYGFRQDPHRLFKILLGVMGFSFILIKPRFGLLLLPIATPFLPWMPKVPVPGMNPLNALLFAVFGTFALTKVLNRQPLFRANSLGVVIGLLMGMNALSIARGAAFPTGYGYDAGFAGLWLFRYAMTFSVYFITLSMAHGETDRRRMAWAIVLGLLAEAWTTILFGKNGSGGRAIGTFGQSNELGAFLAMFTTFAVSMFLGARNLFARLSLGGIAFAGVIATFLTLSRGSILALGVGFLFVALRTSRVLTVIVVAVLATSPIWIPQDVKDRMAETQVGVEGSDDVTLEASSQMRIDTWNAILKVVSEHPLDGVGMLGLAYVLPMTGGEMGLEVKDSAHNTFLRMLGELGVFGLILFCFILWKVYRLGEAGMKASRNPFDRQLSVGLMATTLVLAVSCWFGDRFYSILITGNFWIACALVDDLVSERRENPAVEPARAAA
jgi:O-antigen ligase